MAHGRVHAPEAGPQLHVGALDVQPRGGLDRRGPSPPSRPASGAGTDGLARLDRVVAQVLGPDAGDGVAPQQAAPHRCRVEHRVEADDLQSRLRMTWKTPGASAHRSASSAADSGALGPPRWSRGVAVGRHGRLDRVRLSAAGKERLAHRRVLDQVERIGGVAPQLGRPGTVGLCAQRPPRGTAVRAVTAGVGRAQGGRACVAHRVVEHQPLAAGLDEGQRAQALEGVLGRASGSIARSSGGVTRRTTDAASSAWRASGSRTSSRNTRLSSSTTRWIAAASSPRSGRSVRPRPPA